jgi:hypothetical protein
MWTLSEASARRLARLARLPLLPLIPVQRLIPRILSLVLLMGIAHARAADPIKIGVLNDQSGIYADLAGPGSVIAARLAVGASTQPDRRSCRCRSSYPTFMPSDCRSPRTLPSPRLSTGTWMTRPGHGRSASAAWSSGRMPTMAQAGVYSAVRHYLKGVERPERQMQMPWQLQCGLFQSTTR